MENIDFMESKLLGFDLDDPGKAAIFRIRLQNTKRINISINGIERLLITEIRDQNVIENISFWPGNEDIQLLRESAFWLFGNSSEECCLEEIKPFVEKSIDRVKSGDLILMDVTAIYGAQVLAAFLSMDIKEVPIN